MFQLIDKIVSLSLQKDKAMNELATILIVEDDRTERRILKNILEQSDFLILDACHCMRALDILDNHSVDLIILDLNLGKTNALDFIPDLRKKIKCPIIMISAEENEEKKVKSINLGADDFIEKPAHPDMIKARVKAHLRRYKTQNSNINNKKNAQENLKFSQWVLDPNRHQIFDNKNKSAGLTMREYKLLSFLLQNSNRAISREDLCNELSEKNYTPSARALDVKIARLRKKICDSENNSPIIQTVRGVGYMFNAV